MHWHTLTLIGLVNSSEGGYDTLTCQLPGHFWHAMSRKCLQASNLNSFFKSEWRQNEGDQQTVVKI